MRTLLLLVFLFCAAAPGYTQTLADISNCKGSASQFDKKLRETLGSKYTRRLSKRRGTVSLSGRYNALKISALQARVTINRDTRTIGVECSNGYNCIEVVSSKSGLVTSRKSSTSLPSFPEGTDLVCFANYLTYILKDAGARSSSWKDVTPRKTNTVTETPSTQPKLPSPEKKEVDVPTRNTGESAVMYLNRLHQHSDWMKMQFSVVGNSVKIKFRSGNYLTFDKNAVKAGPGKSEEHVQLFCADGSDCITFNVPSKNQKQLKNQWQLSYKSETAALYGYNTTGELFGKGTKPTVQASVQGNSQISQKPKSDKRSTPSPVAQSGIYARRAGEAPLDHINRILRLNKQVREGQLSISNGTFTINYPAGHKLYGKVADLRAATETKGHLIKVECKSGNCLTYTRNGKLTPKSSWTIGMGKPEAAVAVQPSLTEALSGRQNSSQPITDKVLSNLDHRAELLKYATAAMQSNTDATSALDRYVTKVSTAVDNRNNGAAMRRHFVSAKPDAEAVVRHFEAARKQCEAAMQYAQKHGLENDYKRFQKAGIIAMNAASASGAFGAGIPDAAGARKMDDDKLMMLIQLSVAPLEGVASMTQSLADALNY